MRRKSTRPPRSVLGLSALAHDPAACLFLDGRLVAAVEEERLNRQKRTTAFPHRAIEHVLKEGGIRFRDLEAIAYYWDDRGRLPLAVLRTLVQLPAHPAGIWRVTKQRIGSYVGPELLREQLAVHTDGDFGAIPRVHYIPHHDAHVAEAWLSAPFDLDAILVIDGRGEYASTSIHRVDRDARTPSVTLLEDYTFPNSLGVFFGAVTQQLGYEANSDEYKVMGLASYGGPDPKWQGRIARLLALRPDGTYQLDAQYLYPERCSSADLPWLNEAGRALLAGTLRDGEEFTADGRNLAFAAQERLDVAIRGLVQRLVSATGARRIAIVGGVAMNAVSIGRLRASGLVDDLHVPLAPTDAGASIGAALALLQRFGHDVVDREQLLNPFQGPSYRDEEIENLLRHCKWPYHRSNDPAGDAAKEIADGRIIGWFDGRLEFGERALGARSILADPRHPEMRDRINACVKRRESYRPFAPSILEEKAELYFQTKRSRRMSEIVGATRMAKETVPAVVHVDGTARPQTVPRDWPLASFRRLIERFDELTGVPLVVNTSFNVKQEPIVCSPDDAIRCFAASGLERLYIGSYVVKKEAAS